MINHRRCSYTRILSQWRASMQLNQPERTSSKKMVTHEQRERLKWQNSYLSTFLSLCILRPETSLCIWYLNIWYTIHGCRSYMGLYRNYFLDCPKYSQIKCERWKCELYSSAWSFTLYVRELCECWECHSDGLWKRPPIPDLLVCGCSYSRAQLM